MNPNQQYPPPAPFGPPDNGGQTPVQAPTPQPVSPAPTIPSVPPQPTVSYQAPGSSTLPQPGYAPAAQETPVDPNNPYAFIVDPHPKQPAAPDGQNTLLKRIIVAVCGVAVLVILGVIAVNLLIPKDGSGAQLTGLAQEQQEIVRVAALTARQAKTTNVQDFANNIQLSVGSSQQAMVAYITKYKLAEISDKTLESKHDNKTDTLLTSAQAANTFDSTAAEKLTAALGTYQADLKKAYEAIKGAKARAVIQASYDTAVLLTAQGSSLTISP